MRICALGIYGHRQGSGAVASKSWWMALRQRHPAVDVALAGRKKAEVTGAQSKRLHCRARSFRLVAQSPRVPGLVAMIQEH